MLRFRLPSRGHIRLRQSFAALLLCVGSAAAVLASAPAAIAQTFTWGGVGSTTTTSSYGTATNWSTTSAGAPPVNAGQSAIFGAPGSATVTTSGTIAPDAWGFSTTAQSYSISGGAINFSLSGPSGGLIDNANSGQSITISNNIGGAVPNTQVEILGNSTLTLTGTNTYSGVTTIGAGTLALAGNGSIASTLYVAFQPGGGGAHTFDISQTNAGATVGGLFAPSATGIVSLGSRTLTITGGSFFGGVIQDGGIAGGTGGSVVIAGFATQQFEGTNTYTGSTTIAVNGELDLDNSGAHNGSIATSSGLTNNGFFDISQLSSSGTSIKSLSGDSTGDVSLGSKTLTITNASGTYAGIIEDNFGPGGKLVLSGGSEILSGINTYTGSTTVNGGALIVNGSIATSSLTTVNSGGTFGGSGSVGNISIASGGAFAPGYLTPGTFMTVTGNLAFASGAQYLLQLSGTSTYANVSGTAALAGNVVASFVSGGSISKQYTILTANGGRGVSTFDSLTVNGGPSIVTPTLVYDATHAYLNFALTSPIGGGAGLNINQQNVATALTNYFNAGGAVPVSLLSLTPAGLTQASGELATGSQQATFDAMNMFMGLLTDPFVAGRSDGAGPSGRASLFADENADDGASAYAAKNPKAAQSAFAKLPTKAEAARNDLFDPRWSVWGAAYGGGSSTSGNATLGSNDATARAFGFVGGADRRISPSTLVGFALAGGGTNFSVSGFNTGRSDLFQAGAFVRHNVGSAYVSASAAYGFQSVTTDRTVTAAGTDQMRAQFNANAYSGRLEGGYRYVTPWMGVTPYAAAQFTTYSLPAYAEQTLAGSGAFALNYAAKDVTASRTEFGIRTDKSIALPDAILTLRGRFAWAHDFYTDRSVTAVFQSVPGASFVVNGAAQASDSALTTATAEVKWLNGISLAATFEGQFSNVTTSFAGKGVARYVW